MTSTTMSALIAKKFGASIHTQGEKQPATPKSAPSRVPSSSVDTFTRGAQQSFIRSLPAELAPAALRYFGALKPLVK